MCLSFAMMKHEPLNVVEEILSHCRLLAAEVDNVTNHSMNVSIKRLILVDVLDL